MKKILLLFLFLSSQLFSFSQKPIIKNLVFEGAGMRGIAYCGAIQELESRNMMQTVERTGGTSAGAIMALIVSLGYTGKETEAIIGSTDFKQFNDGRYLFAGGINRLNKYFGWYRGKQFGKWLSKIIEEKTGDENISFEELHQKGFKDLYVTGTCLNKQSLVIFSRETYPKMKVKDAVRISMSIPLYFEAVFIDKDGKVINHPKKKDSLDIMVDGGFTGNFPIQIFDKPGNPDSCTLGFRIDSELQIEHDKMNRLLAPMPIKNIKQYMNAFYNMVIENLNRGQLKEADWQRTISISDGKISPRIRKLSTKEINTLIENARMATRTYLN